MKKITLLLVVLSFIICQGTEVFGQTSWAATGAKWHFEYNYGYGNATSYVTLESIGDTMIQDINCSILLLESIRNNSFNRRYYTYKEADKVWLFDGNEFRLLYDFGLNAGETFETYGPPMFAMLDCDSTTTVFVESTGIEEVNGNQYRYQVVSLSEPYWHFGLVNSATYTISEKFGSYGFFIPQTTCGSADLDTPSKLRCYEDDEIGLFSISGTEDCEYEEGVGVQDLTLTNDISIYPNPVTNDLTVELKNYRKESVITIFSLDGRMILKEDLLKEKSILHLSPLESGMYFIKVSHNHQNSGGKLMKL